MVSGFAQAQNLNDAYLRLQQSIAKNPDDLNLKMDLAYLFSQGLEFKRAIALYREVVASDPKNKRAWAELCVLHTGLRETQQANEACQQSTNLTPDNYLVYDNQGLSHYKLGQLPESLKPFLLAVSLNKQATLARYHMIQTIMGMKEYDLARVKLEEIAANDKLSTADRVLVNHGLYLVHSRLKQHDQAYEAIKNVYTMSGNHLYLGKVITSYLKSHEIVTFGFVAVMTLLACQYFGTRVNRFLKNAD